MRRDAPALAFAMLFPAAMAYVYFIALSGEGGETRTAMQAAYVAGKVIQFAFPAAYVLLAYGLASDGRYAPPWRLPGWRGLVLGVGFGLLVGVGILGLYEVWLRHTPLAPVAAGKVRHKLQEMGCNTPERFLALTLFLAVVHAFGEEYYWRWFVFGWLRRYLALPAAVALASLAFMGNHVIVLAVYFPPGVALVLALGVAIGGAVWALLYEVTRSLVATWLSHMLIDLAIMAVGYQLVAGYWE